MSNTKTGPLPFLEVMGRFKGLETLGTSLLNAGMPRTQQMLIEVMTALTDPNHTGYANGAGLVGVNHNLRNYDPYTNLEARVKSMFGSSSAQLDLLHHLRDAVIVDTLARSMAAPPTPVTVPPDELKLLRASWDLHPDERVVDSEYAQLVVESGKRRVQLQMVDSELQERLEEQTSHFRQILEVLEFYADTKNYDSGLSSSARVERDGGHKARGLLDGIRHLTDHITPISDTVKRNEIHETDEKDASELVQFVANQKEQARQVATDLWHEKVLQYEKEMDAVAKMTGFHIVSMEGGGPENIPASLALSVGRLQQEYKSARQYQDSVEPRIRELKAERDQFDNRWRAASSQIDHLQRELQTVIGQRNRASDDREAFNNELNDVKEMVKQFLTTIQHPLVRQLREEPLWDRMEAILTDLAGDHVRFAGEAEKYRKFIELLK